MLKDDLNIMLKKVLLVTLYDENNIGNRLQNYALQKKLKNYGADITILDNYYTTVPSIIDTVKIFIKKVLIKIGCSKYEKACNDFFSLKKIRMSNKGFNKSNFNNILRLKNEDAFSYNWSSYDLAIAGSDQVWHKWKNDLNELPYYYLQFLPKEKRTAYAASFGFESFPKDDIEQHTKGLQGMNKISCREKSGCRLVKELVGKDVIRVLDPTLLLSVSDWKEIESQSSSVQVIDNKQKYVFLYFLGEITEEYSSYIKSIMKNNNIDVIVDFSNDETLKSKRKGPAEFINLIDNAEYVFTDSFHCTVFSLLFNKKFTVFRRQQPGFEKMFGRIEDLLASKNALEHIYGGTDVKPTNDFDKLYDVSVAYLKGILKVDE